MVRWISRVGLTFAGLLLIATTANGQINMFNSMVSNADPTGVATCDRGDPDIELRVLPLGASIVAGVGSSDGNGFRAHLRDALADMKVEFVGTLRSGSMADNYHEGHSGFTISQTEDTALTAVPFRPNVILLHIGTNDLGEGRADYNGSTQRLGNLLDLLLAKMPEATILVCQITGSKDTATNSRIQTFNGMIPRLVQQRLGKHILAVNMTSIKADLLVDGVHPNDPGYRLMANKFQEGIEQALKLGWIHKPGEPHLLPDPSLIGPTCDGQREVPSFGKRASESSHLCAGNVIWSQRKQIGQVDDGTLFADMDGDGLDDTVTIRQDGEISVWLNGQANPSAPYLWNWFSQNNGNPIAEGVGAGRDQYRLADINGDGKADMIIVDATGNMTALLNNGPAGIQPLRWIWTELGQISPAVGDAAGVRFTDVTGDGKADLIWLDEGSRMTIYRNEWGSGLATERYWTFTKITQTPIDLNAQHPGDMHFADIDGDQKSDAIWVHPSDGSIVVWLNRDSTTQDGWIYPFNTMTPPHDPIPSPNVIFGRIHVPYGRADYMVRDPQSGAISVWKNECNNYAPGSSNPMDNADGIDNKLNSLDQPLEPRQNPPLSSPAILPSSIRSVPTTSTRPQATSVIRPVPPKTTTPPSSRPQAPSSQSQPSITGGGVAFPASNPSQTSPTTIISRPSSPGSSTSTSSSTAVGGVVVPVPIVVPIAIPPPPAGIIPPPPAGIIPPPPGIPPPPPGIPPAPLGIIPPPAGIIPAPPKPAAPKPAPKPAPKQAPQSSSPPRPSSAKSSDKSSSTSSSKTSSCSSSTVTNFWVSCQTVSSGKTVATSCKTTSTATSKGCSIAATTHSTSTTRASCPLITLDPDADQGQDGEPPKKDSCQLIKLDPNEDQGEDGEPRKDSCPVVKLDPNEDQGEDEITSKPSGSTKPLPKATAGLPLPPLPKGKSSGNPTSKSISTKSSVTNTSSNKPSSAKVSSTVSSSSSTSSKVSPSPSIKPLAPPAPPDNSLSMSKGPGYDDPEDYTSPTKNSKGWSIPKIPKWPWWLPFPRWPKGTKKPSPPENLFVVGYFQNCEKTHPLDAFIGPDENCGASAALFRGHEGDNNACQNKPLWLDDEEKTPHNPTLPQKITFEGGGRKNCEYDRSQSATSGTLFCDGVRADCTKLDPEPFKIECTKEGSLTKSWHKQIHCIFPLPTPPGSTPPTPQFVVGFFDWCKDKTCASQPAVFAPFGDDDFACAEKPIYRDSKSGPAKGPKLPETLKFSGAGRKDCEFHVKSATDAGTMRCGTDKGRCVKNDEMIRDCGAYDKKERWRAQVTCTFDTFDGKPLQEPPPAPPTPPPPPTKKFAVGYFQKCMDGKDKRCQSQAGIFVPPAEGDDKNFACIDKPSHRDVSWADKERPTFPQYINLEGGGRKDCEYKRSEDDDVGWIKCGKDQAIKCRKEEIEERSCKDFGKDETWRTQLSCDFNSFEGETMAKRGLDILSVERLQLSGSFTLPSKSSSLDRRLDLFPSAKDALVEPRAPMKGRLYSVGFFHQCVTAPGQSSSGRAKTDCFFQPAIFIPGAWADPFFACKDTPEALGLWAPDTSDPAQSPVPQKMEFQDDWKRKCRYVRGDRKSTGTLTCDGVAPVICKKVKAVPRNCDGKKGTKGKEKGVGVSWRTEVTCYVKWSEAKAKRNTDITSSVEPSSPLTLQQTPSPLTLPPLPPTIEHLNLASKTPESSLDARGAPWGKLYSIGYFTLCLQPTIFILHAPVLECFTRQAIYVSEGDPFAVCKKDPQYINSFTDGDKPKMPMKVDFMDEKKRKCTFERKNGKEAGMMLCEGLGGATCVKARVVRRDCKGKGNEAVWRHEVTCLYGSF